MTLSISFGSGNRNSSDYKAFERAVRDVIQEKSFLDTWIENMRIESKVDTALDSKLPGKMTAILDDKLPGKVERELRNQLSTEINKTIMPKVIAKITQELKDYSRDTIPDRVKAVMTEQIAIYLNSHVTMRNILDSHSIRIQNELSGISDKSVADLSRVATDTLSRVVNEAQYHVVTDLHISAMKTKYDNALTVINDNAIQQIGTINDALSSQLAKNDAAFAKQLSDTQKLVNDELTEIRLKEQQMKDIQKVNEELEIRVKLLSNSLNTLQNICIVGFGSLVVSVGYIFSKSRCIYW